MYLYNRFWAEIGGLQMCREQTASSHAMSLVVSDLVAMKHAAYCRIL